MWTLAENCFVCNQPNHVAADCTHQYCQRCGQWGHGMQRCNQRSTIRSVTDNAIDTSVPEESAKVDIIMEGQSCAALLDSCASVSLIDLKTLQDMEINTLGGER